MSFVPLRVPFVSLLTLAASLPAQEPGQEPAEPVWHSDLDAARAIAAEQHKPLFVTFRCER